jgi:hypothetical protein
MDPISTRVAMGAAGAAVGPAEDIIIGLGVSPYIYSYPISSAGFGVRYSNPATLPPGMVNKIVVTPTKDAILLAVDSSPFCVAYQYLAGTGFGTRYSNPSTLPADASQCFDISIHPNNNAVLLGNQPFAGTGSQIHAYQWNSTTGFGTKYSNPSSFPTGNVSGVSFSPGGNDIAYSNGGAIGARAIDAYAWNSSTGFGTKYTNGTLNASGKACRFHTSGNAVLQTNSGNTFSGSVIAISAFQAYRYTSGTGFGTLYSTPGGAPTGNLSRDVAISPNGADVVFGYDLSPYIYCYPFNTSTGFGTKYADPTTLPTGIGFSVNFSSSGKLIAIGYNSSPYISVYNFNSGTGFGAKVNDPSQALTFGATSIAFCSSA